MTLHSSLKLIQTTRHEIIPFSSILLNSWEAKTIIWWYEILVLKYFMSTFIFVGVLFMMMRRKWKISLIQLKYFPFGKCIKKRKILKWFQVALVILIYVWKFIIKNRKIRIFIFLFPIHSSYTPSTASPVFNFNSHTAISLPHNYSRFKWFPCAEMFIHKAVSVSSQPIPFQSVHSREYVALLEPRCEYETSYYYYVHKEGKYIGHMYL